MGFKDAINNLKQKQDYEKEIAELKKQLAIAEKENDRLQKRLNNLEKPAKSLTKADETLQLGDDVAKIGAELKQELEKLPYDQKVSSVYNRLFVLIDYLCVPVLKALGMNEEVKHMEYVSRTIKKSSAWVIFGVCTHSKLNSKSSASLSDMINTNLNKLVGCDKEKQEEAENFNKDIQDIELLKSVKDSGIDMQLIKETQVLVNHIRNKYDVSKLNNTIGDNPAAIKEWLQMVIELGTLVSDFGYGKGDEILRYNLKCLQDKTKCKEFTPNNVFKSTKASQAIFDLLVKLRDEFGINLSEMYAGCGGYNVCDCDAARQNTTNNQNILNMIPDKERN